MSGTVLLTLDLDNLSRRILGSMVLKAIEKYGKAIKITSLYVSQ